MASFPYYQLPQFFFSAEFRAEHKLSIEAKVLYAIMQSRVQLSEKNNLVDYKFPNLRYYRNFRIRCSFVDGLVFSG